MHELRIDVADLLTHPAARRAVHLDVVVDGLGTPVARIDAPVVIDLVLERVPDGIVARGTFVTRYDAECGNCLRPVSGELAVAVSELYEDHPVEGDTYALDGIHVDLDQLVRDALVLELPIAPTCAADDSSCVALHDEHTVDVESGDEADSERPADPRWAALSQLEL